MLLSLCLFLVSWVWLCHEWTSHFCAGSTTSRDDSPSQVPGTSELLTHSTIVTYVIKYCHCIMYVFVSLAPEYKFFTGPISLPISSNPVSSSVIPPVLCWVRYLRGDHPFLYRVRHQVDLPFPCLVRCLQEDLLFLFQVQAYQVDFPFPCCILCLY